MDNLTQYQVALGVFRQQSTIWASSARELAAVAHRLDPRGEMPDDPMAVQIMEDVVKEFRALGAIVPGVRQLFAASLGVK